MKHSRRQKMNRHLSLISPWVEHLCVPMINGANASTNLDFNRFRYLGIPKTHEIKAGNATPLERDEIAQNLFIAIIERRDASPSTKANIFNAARKHFSFCDNQEIKLVPLSEKAFVKELEALSVRQRRGEIKDSTVSRLRADLSTLFQWLELNSNIKMPTHLHTGTTQSTPTRGYSDQDLKQLLPLLRSIFKQLYPQFVKEPLVHMQAASNSSTMSFYWKGEEYEVCGGTTKLFCTATFLLSYYTWSNSTTLYNLKRPKISSHSLSENWYQMPAFKRRAFKTITVELGDNNQFEIPKYATQFFNQLLTASKLLDPSPNGLLLPAYSCRKKKIQNMSGCILNDFKAKWLNKFFPLQDERGEKLWPVPRRFRATGSHLTLARKGPVEAAILLDNTPNTIKSSYSTGNPHENDKMNRDTILTLEQTVRDRQSVEAAKAKVIKAQKVDVLTYDAYVRRASPPTRSAHGSYCKDSDGHKAEKFTARARQHRLISDREQLACADLLKCWSCDHQVLVESAMDIWCILSFRECLEESIYLHIDKTHHQENFAVTIEKINLRLKSLQPKVVRDAHRRLASEGRHPLWLDIDSVIMNKGSV